ncbi:MAG: methyltransferase domain-containing protein, partial [Bacillota bacterium]|nr:methyltransferase domain-containing protein [Bacillota bacterium]
KSLLDLYCGVGSIGICASEYASEIVGIEIVEEAVENARKNAMLNQVENARYYAGPCEELLSGVLKDFTPDVVILDPPRGGADAAALSALIDKSPPRIVYVSCNPTTLARDLKQLIANGYTLEKVSIVDMFPYTTSVECIALLQRGRSTMPSAAPTKGVERE